MRRIWVWGRVWGNLARPLYYYRLISQGVMAPGPKTSQSAEAENSQAGLG